MFLPLKVRFGVWVVLKFKKWSARYVFDLKNGLVHRAWDNNNKDSMFNIAHTDIELKNTWTKIRKNSKFQTFAWNACDTLCNTMTHI